MNRIGYVAALPLFGRAVSVACTYLLKTTFFKIISATCETNPDECDKKTEDCIDSGYGIIRCDCKTGYRRNGGACNGKKPA